MKYLTKINSLKKKNKLLLIVNEKKTLASLKEKKKFCKKQTKLAIGNNLFNFNL